MSINLVRRSATSTVRTARARTAFNLQGRAGGCFGGSRGKATLPELPYAYDALEPAISAQIMRLHHQKHHQTYVTGFNDASARLTTALQHEHTTTTTSTSPDAAASAAAAVAALQPLLAFHSGGHANHSLFWENLSPAANANQGREKGEGGGAPQGPLAEAVERSFGGLEALKAVFTARLAAVQGSGWAWLVRDEATGGLSVRAYANQDPVVPPFKPILGIDAWEHAYYLQYENRKAEYFKAIWDVINWRTAERRFE